MQFVPNAVGGYGGDSATPRKFCNFYSHLSLETVFPALKVIENCYINMTISSWKLTPSLFFKHTVNERLSPQPDKIWNYGDFKNPNVPALQWIGKKFEVQPRFISKKPNFPLFFWIEKIWEVQLKNIHKSQNLSVDLEVLPKTNTHKSQFRIYVWIGKSYVLIEVSLLKVRWVIYIE